MKSHAKIRPGVLVVIAFALAVLLFSIFIMLDTGPQDGPGFQETSQSDRKEIGDKQDGVKPGQDQEIVPILRSSELEPHDITNNTLRGMVIEEDGAPAPQARVLAMRILKDQSPEKALLLETYSDSDGCFHFNDQPKGEYSLTAIKGNRAGMYRSQPSVFWQNSKTWFEIVLKPSGLISGTVRDPKGNPVPNALVYPPLAPGLMKRTNNNGEFVLKNLEVGEYNIIVSASGFALKQINQVLIGEENLKIRLDSGWEVQGNITLNDKPAPDIKVFIQSQDRWMMPWIHSKSDHKGDFCIPHMAAGKYLLGISNKEVTCVGGVLAFMVGGNLEKLKIQLLKRPSVSGRVLAAPSSEPLNGIPVQAVSTGFQGYFTQTLPTCVLTDKEGCYQFTSLPAGDFTIWTTGGKGYASSSAKLDIYVNEDEAKENIDLLIEKGVKFCISLTSHEGTPICGAELILKRNDLDRLFPIETLPEAIEEGDGKYFVQWLGPGRYKVQINRYGWAEKYEEFVVDAELETQSLDVVLTPTISAKGKVVDSNGRGVEGAIVTYRYRQKTLTNEDGIFCIYNVTPGMNWISIRKKGYLDSFKTITVTGDEEFVATLHKDGDSLISGRVINDLGQPLSGVALRVQQNVKEVSLDKTTHTDEKGAFRFDGLMEVMATLEVDSMHGGVVNEQQFKQVKTNQTNLEIVINRFARVKGKVKHASGAPVKRFNLTASTDGSRNNTVVKRCADGEFDLNTLAPGKVWLNAFSFGEGDGQAGPLTIQPNETLENVEIVLDPCAIVQGKILDKFTLKPIPGARVYINRFLRNNRWDLQRLKPKAVSDDEGAFEVKMHDFDLVNMVVTHPEYSIGYKKSIELIRGEVSEFVEIHLSRGCRVKGFVLQNGIGRQGVHIYGSGPGSEYISIQTGRDGGYDVSGLAPGAYRFRATLGDKRNKRSVVKNLTLREGEALTCDFIFQDQGSISGKVTQQGQPISDARVTSNTDHGTSDAFSAETYSDKEGFYQLTGLPMGEYSVTLTMDNRNPVGKQVSLLQGSAVCNFELGPSGAGELIGFVCENGIPCKGARISLMRQFPSKSAVSDKNGFYRIKDIPFGKIKIRASIMREGRRHITRDSEIRIHETLQEDFNFQKGTGSISGAITINGEPGQYVTVDIWPDAGGLKDSFCVSMDSSNGDFTASGFSPGFYFVRINQPWHMVKKVEVKDQSVSNVSFNITKGDAEITGKVKHPKGFNPQIFLFKPGACSWQAGDGFLRPTHSMGLVATLYPSNGSFQQANLNAGEYDLVGICKKDKKIVLLDKKRIILKDKETVEVNLDLKK